MNNKKSKKEPKAANWKEEECVKTAITKQNRLRKKKRASMYIAIVLGILAIPLTLVMLDKLFLVVESYVPVYWGKDEKQFTFGRGGTPVLVPTMVSGNQILFDIKNVASFVQLLKGERTYTKKPNGVADGFVFAPTENKLVSIANGKKIGKRANEWILTSEAFFGQTTSGTTYRAKWQYHPSHVAIENCEIKHYRVPLTTNNNSYRARASSSAGYHAVISLDKLIELYAPGVQYKYQDDALYLW